MRADGRVPLAGEVPVMTSNPCRSCFENALERHDAWQCRVYQAQITWTKRFLALAKDAGASVRRAPPSPDYSTPKAVTRRALEAAGRGIRPSPFFRDLLRLAGRV